MAKTTIPAGYFAAGSIATADIAANAITSAKLAQNSVLTKHIDDNQIVMGYPAVPLKEFLKNSKK